MKNIKKIQPGKLFASMVLFASGLLLSIQSYAQDKKVDVNINTNSDKGNNFFMQPWVWIVGGAVFILLLVALLRGNRSKD